jgi:hypothetical protein
MAKTIVVSQGNQFIKELLRRHEIKIGANKTDFLKNLNDAIDDGRLTQGDFEEWLDEVEGWGNQHVYFFAVPPRKSRAEILRLVQASASGALVNVGRSHTFPESLTLTGIDVSNASVSFSWHRGTLTADRVEAKDKPNEEIEGDTYEFRAYRQRSNRAVMRFVWQFDLPYSAVFLQLPNEGHDHRDALGLVHEQLRQTGLALRPLARVPLSNAAKRLGTSARASAKSQTMHTHGGYISLVATLETGGIEEVEAVKEARRGVNLDAFQSADGRYRLAREEHKTLSKDINFEIFGATSRVRIWVNCKKDDVYYVTNLLWEQNH